MNKEKKYKTISYILLVLLCISVLASIILGYLTDNLHMQEYNRYCTIIVILDVISVTIFILWLIYLDSSATKPYVFKLDNADNLINLISKRLTENNYEIIKNSNDLKIYSKVGEFPTLRRGLSLKDIIAKSYSIYATVYVDKLSDALLLKINKDIKNELYNYYPGLEYASSPSQIHLDLIIFTNETNLIEEAFRNRPPIKHISSSISSIVNISNNKVYIERKREYLSTPIYKMNLNKLLEHLNISFDNEIIEE